MASTDEAVKQLLQGLQPVEVAELPGAGALVAPLFDVHQVAELLQVSPRSVWRWTAAGQFPRPMRLGRLRRWSRESVQAWLDSRRG